MNALYAIALVLFVAIMLAVKAGLVALTEWGGPAFVDGALFGGFYVGILFWIGYKMDLRSGRLKRMD
jgi:hypothetical protein